MPQLCSDVIFKLYWKIKYQRKEPTAFKPIEMHRNHYSSFCRVTAVCRNGILAMFSRDLLRFYVYIIKDFKICLKLHSVYFRVIHNVTVLFVICAFYVSL